jgi:hypothetical protein
MIHALKRVVPTIIVLLGISGLPALSGTPEAARVYDIQVGCIEDPGNAARLANWLKKWGLPWYSLSYTSCTRFIIDTNADNHGEVAFVKHYPDITDVFLVENIWDLPHPDPMMISPIPPKGAFVEIMAPYMQYQYQNGYYNHARLPMEEERARMYTGFIYEAADFYKIDPFLIFALGNFESYFYNMFGDLNRLTFRRPDPAQGMFQILRSTARLIYEEMKQQNLPHTPKEFPLDLRRHPKAQIYFAVHYMHKLHLEHHGNRYMALIGYNACNNPNYQYPERVMRFYQRAIRHFLKESEADTVEGRIAAGSSSDSEDEEVGGK